MFLESVQKHDVANRHQAAESFAFQSGRRIVRCQRLTRRNEVVNFTRYCWRPTLIHESSRRMTKTGHNNYCAEIG